MIPHLTDECGAGRVRPDRRNEHTITENALKFLYEFVTYEWQTYDELATHGHTKKSIRTWAQKWEYHGMIEISKRGGGGRKGRATILIRRI